MKALKAAIFGILAISILSACPFMIEPDPEPTPDPEPEFPYAYEFRNFADYTVVLRVPGVENEDGIEMFELHGQETRTLHLAEDRMPDLGCDVKGYLTMQVQLTAVAAERTVTIWDVFQNAVEYEVTGSADWVRLTYTNSSGGEEIIDLHDLPASVVIPHYTGIGSVIGKAENMTDTGWIFITLYIRDTIAQWSRSTVPYGAVTVSSMF